MLTEPLAVGLDRIVVKVALEVLPQIQCASVCVPVSAAQIRSSACAGRAVLLVVTCRSQFFLSESGTADRISGSGLVALSLRIKATVRRSDHRGYGAAPMAIAVGRIAIKVAVEVLTLIPCVVVLAHLRVAIVLHRSCGSVRSDLSVNGMRDLAN